MDDGRFEINQLLFLDDTALMADPEEMLCRLVIEFGRVCKRSQFRINLGKRKVMRCSSHVNLAHFDGRPNGELLDEVDCYTYLRTQVATDGGCETYVGHQ